MKCSKCGQEGDTRYCPECGGRLMSEGDLICLKLNRSFKKWNRLLDNSSDMGLSKHGLSIIRKNCFDTATRIQAIQHGDYFVRGEWMTQREANEIMGNTRELYQQAIAKLEGKKGVSIS